MDISFNAIANGLRHPVLAFYHFFNKAKLITLDQAKQIDIWEKTGFASPSPHFVKQTCLLRNGIPGSTWVETGTYLGETTEVLSRNAKHVHTIEPEPNLCQAAKLKFTNKSNVTVHEGTSEDIFPELLPSISGDVSFWLDGHFSAGNTFQGENDTPILQELTEINKNLHRWDRVVVMVDDMRCFNPNLPSYSSYPEKSVLVDWANSNNLFWTIEHDIFIAINEAASESKQF